MRYRGTEGGRFKERGMVGNPVDVLDEEGNVVGQKKGILYGTAALYSDAEIAAMLADGVIEEPVAPPKPLPTPEEALKKAKRNAKRGMKEARDYVKYTPFTTPLGRFDANQESIINILVASLGIASAPVPPATIEWTDADDNTIDLTLEQLNGVIAAGMANGDAVHKTYRELKKQINQATTVEEIQGVEGEGGIKWPWPDGIDPRGAS